MNTEKRTRMAQDARKADGPTQNTAPAPKIDSGEPETLSEAARRTLKDIPKVYQKLYIRAMGGRSRRAAMEAKCSECMGWVRGDVPHCTSPGCPLFPYRLARPTSQRPRKEAGEREGGGQP